MSERNQIINVIEISNTQTDKSNQPQTWVQIAAA